MSIIRYAVFNDVHFRYQSPAYYRAIKIVARWDNLRGIILNGDIIDFESVCTHPTLPTGQKLLMYEVEYANQQFDFLQKTFQDIPIGYCEGNHEFRVFRFIRDECPSLWGLIDCPKLLKFDERPGWKFFRYGPGQLVNVHGTGLWVRHEPLSMGMSPAKVTAENSSVDILFGHTHIYQVYAHKKFGPTPFVTRAYSNGWLGDINAPVFEYRGSKDRWVNGFAEILIDEKTLEYQYNFVDLSKFNPFYEVSEKSA